MLNNILAVVFPVDYQQYLKSPRWRKKAATARKRAGYRCQLCNKQKPLEVHHRTYERLGYELPSDLIALCAACHKRHHGRH
jgi:5-methylcytosine-specific restriction endonuclease McrA